MSGYIKLHRGWQDSLQFSDEPYCERAAWCWLLSNAAWKDTVRRTHRGEVVNVTRGQYHTSLRVLANEWRWSIKRVRTFLTVLEKCGSIGTQGAQGGTTITICKYDNYQSGGHEAGTQEASHGARSGHTQEEGKERKEEKKTRVRAIASRPDGVSEALWARFIDMRKAKSAPVTQRALDGLQREAAKAQWPLADVLAYCVSKNWRGFEASWVRGQIRPGGIGT
jgi:hypothetical protein